MFVILNGTLRSHVIASGRRGNLGSGGVSSRDCFVACAPRNDREGKGHNDGKGKLRMTTTKGSLRMTGSEGLRMTSRVCKRLWSRE